MKPVNEQCILVTGATDGIGMITARRLAQQGATVLLHGRDADKCRQVMKEIQRETGNPCLECFIADFSSLPEVRHLATAIGQSHDHLDVLINNAGVLPPASAADPRPVGAQGHELCMTVNYLAPFLLTHLLLPCLRGASSARIVNVASAAQEAIDFDDLMVENDYGPMRAYSRSKLALVLFTVELSHRLRGDPITVNCMHPGSLLDTKMVRQAFSRPMGSAQSGAEVEVFLATAPELDRVTGTYFYQKRPARAHPQAYDEAARQHLWQVSMALTGLTTPFNA